MSTQQQRNGQPESLARAKASLKERLMLKMKQEVLEELQDTERVVSDALALLEGEEGFLKGLKETFKARLLDRVKQEVIQEVAGEVSDSSLDDVAGDEALTDAKDQFKVRLIDHILQQAVSEVSTEAGWAQDALEVHANGDIVKEARETFKSRLREHVFEQAAEEVGTELGGEAEDLVEQADGERLDEAKEAIKQRLLDHVLQQAIAEIDAEVDVVPEEYMDFADTIDGSLDVEEVVEQVYEDLTQELEASELGISEEETGPGEEKLAEPTAASTKMSFADDQALEEDEDGFFLDDPSAHGNVYATGSDDSREMSYSGDGAVESMEPLPESMTEYVVDNDVNIVINNEEQEDAGREDGSGEFLYFIYGILSGVDVDKELLPKEGINPAFPVYPISHNHASALVSRVSSEDFGQAVRTTHMENPEWVAQHKGAYDVLVEELALLGAFLPFPFGSVYDSESEVRRMLSEISYLDALEKIQGRSQWRIRVFRDVDVLHQQVVEKSPAVQRLMTDIKSQPKGGAQSIKKQMVSTIREEEAAFTDQCTGQVHDRLFSLSDDVELGAMEEGERSDKKELILDASYLVHRDKHAAFRQDIDALTGEFAPLGFEFRVNGPEPPSLFSRFQPEQKLDGVE